MAGLESFNMDYQRHRPSRSISEVHASQQSNFTDTEILRQQQRETLMAMSRNKGNFKIIFGNKFINVILDLFIHHID